jgi:hypothetical protein
LMIRAGQPFSWRSMTGLIHITGWCRTIY